MEAIITTTEQKAFIGMELDFNEGDFNYAIRTAGNTVIPAINAVIAAYRQLGLPDEFNKEKLFELFNYGTGKTRAVLEEMIRKDVESLSSVLLKNETMQKVDLYMKPLDEVVIRLRESINEANRDVIPIFSKRYNFSIQDFGIEEGRAVVNKDRIRKYFTQTIDNENQVKAYEYFQKLAETYNEGIKFFKDTGNKFPPVGLIGSGMHASFLNRPYKDGFPIGDELKLMVTFLGEIK